MKGKYITIYVRMAAMSHGRKQSKKAAFPPPLAAGDNYNEITVVSIDIENNTVRIKNGDAETTLDFEKNGVKAAAVAATPGQAVCGKLGITL